MEIVEKLGHRPPRRARASFSWLVMFILVALLLYVRAIYLSFHLEEEATMRVEEHFLHADKDVHAPLDKDRDALIAAKSDREAHKAPKRDRDSNNATERHGAAYKAPKRDRDNHITAKMVDASHKASERNGDADKAAKRDGATNDTAKRYRAVNEDNRTTNARAAITNNETGVGAPVGVTNIVAARNITPIVTYGPPRTASTLQFNFVCVCLFVHLLEYYANLANETLCYAQGEGQFLKTDRPQVMKTHTLKMNYAEKSVIFGTARIKHKGEEAAAEWERHNSTVGLIQDLETLSKIGMGGYLDLYASYFNLPSRYVPMLNEYFELWEKLRICCGAQMSKHWRHELNPNATPHKLEPHPFCGSLDIDEVEGEFMNTSMFKLIDAHDLERSINGPSQVDGKLDGTYCSRYNNAVRTKGLSHNQLLGQ